jgi:RNA polymerase sigma-70 factor (ECF subfamily)
MATKMCNSCSPDFVSRLSRAKSASEKDRHDLLEGYRNYLLLLTSIRSDRKLRIKMGDSDLVQETLIQANRDFDQFRGISEEELTSWLRAILSAKKAKLARRYYGTAARDPRLETQMQDEMNNSSQLLDRAFLDYGSSQSRQAAGRERSVLLADALAALPEHYREVVVLRHIKGYKLAEVAESMDRSVDSVKKLWARAMIQLRTSMNRSRNV